MKIGDVGSDSIFKDSTTLIPAIVQDSTTHEVLMLAYMNRAALTQTMETGRATYWSRSRNELWIKGATSGHFQDVQSISLDCDSDTILLQVIQTGAACHTGERTCFHKPIDL
jgi:phosphoribosyl-AMP cyclohydrolase